MFSFYNNFLLVETEIIGMIGLYLAKYLVVKPVSENTIISLDFISYAICTAEQATISLVLRGL